MEQYGGYIAPPPPWRLITKARTFFFGQQFKNVKNIPCPLSWSYSVIFFCFIALKEKKISGYATEKHPVHTVNNNKDTGQTRIFSTFLSNILFLRPHSKVKSTYSESATRHTKVQSTCAFYFPQRVFGKLKTTNFVICGRRKNTVHYS